MRRLPPGLAAALVVAGVAVVGAFGRSSLRIPPGLDAYMPVPDDNAMTPARVALGRRLFFDTRLSADGSLSCGSCHEPARSFTDARARSVGVFGRTGVRSAPALLNRAYGRAFFWDGRAATLEAQVLQPIENPDELGLSADRAVERVAAALDYAGRFEDAFARPVNRADLARALAAYVRSILVGDSPVDKYLNGESVALGAEAREGLRLFRGRGNCAACHLGPTFTDERFHNTGVAWRTGSPLDAGRAAVTGAPADRGAFKTPTLRQIADTAPYMHDGSVASLGEVIEFYDNAGIANPHRDEELRALHLTVDDKRALEAFLRSLSGHVQEGWIER
jgi:cytochrome c peroxidase